MQAQICTDIQYVLPGMSLALKGLHQIRFPDASAIDHVP
jgi:hypothetical protein